jgi:hypothetical protein
MSSSGIQIVPIVGAVGGLAALRMIAAQSINIEMLMRMSFLIPAGASAAGVVLNSSISSSLPASIASYVHLIGGAGVLGGAIGSAWVASDGGLAGMISRDSLMAAALGGLAVFAGIRVAKMLLSDYDSMGKK